MLIIYAANAIVSQPLSVINICKTCNITSWSKYFIVKESISPTQAVVWASSSGWGTSTFSSFSSPSPFDLKLHIAVVDGLDISNMNTVNANLGSPTFKLSRTQCCGGFDVCDSICLWCLSYLITASLKFGDTSSKKCNQGDYIHAQPMDFLIVIVHMPVWFVFV